MKLLLTSSGISNTSIHDALVDLLGKPIAESSALCIPTGVQPFPGGPSHVYRFISGSTGSPMCGLGWKSLGVLELTALPSIKRGVLGTGGPGRLTLCWFGAAVPCICATGCGSPDWPTSCRRCGARRSTSARAAVPWSRLPTSEERPTTTVIRSPAATRALGLVDFSLFPHLEREDMPDTSLANIEKWAAGLSVPAYAIDDQTAIKVVDGTVEVVSEGHWKLFTPSPEAS